MMETQARKIVTFALKVFGSNEETESVGSHTVHQWSAVGKIVSVASYGWSEMTMSDFLIAEYTGNCQQYRKQWWKEVTSIGETAERLLKNMLQGIWNGKYRYDIMWNNIKVINVCWL